MKASVLAAEGTEGLFSEVGMQEGELLGPEQEDVDLETNEDAPRFVVGQ